MWKRFGLNSWNTIKNSWKSSETFSTKFTQRTLYTKTNKAIKIPIVLGFFGSIFGPDYEAIKNDIREILDDYDWDDGSWGPVLVRLGWHASGTYSNDDKTGGSNGATMRFKPESEDGANAGLEYAREKLEQIKEKYPSVSYADLWILASYVAIEEMGGPKIPFRGGRTDKSDGSHCPPVGRLPDAAQGAQHVRDVFYRMGFNDQEIVALVGGGHAIGRCHSDRSGFDGPWTNSPTTVSNEFFAKLLDEDWKVRRWNGPKQYQDRKTGKLMMLETDLAMKTDPEFRKYCEIYYKDNDKFLEDFGAAFKKLTELGF